MHKSFLILLCLIFPVTLLAQETPMNQAEIAAFKSMVEATSKATSTIKSDFVQYKHLDFLDNDIETSGKLAFKAPGWVKWEYTTPYQYSVIFKDDQMLINDGGTKSSVDIGSSKLFKKLNELIVNSVKGTLFKDEDFKISYLKTTNMNKAIFKPYDKKIANYIASFELVFDRDDGGVIEVKMIEPSGDFTKIIFKNRTLNSSLSDAVFTN
ncbi:MAG: outer membrane lipoprotein carrier protein LolA [Altibacter sp.]|nr:outer membrane lipoprotein carrier protein LolA [Altibacter sp.]